MYSTPAPHIHSENSSVNDIPISQRPSSATRTHIGKTRQPSRPTIRTVALPPLTRSRTGPRSTMTWQMASSPASEKRLLRHQPKMPQRGHHSCQSTPQTNGSQAGRSHLHTLSSVTERGLPWMPANLVMQTTRRTLRSLGGIVGVGGNLWNSCTRRDQCLGVVRGRSSIMKRTMRTGIIMVIVVRHFGMRVMCGLEAGKR